MVTIGNPKLVQTGLGWAENDLISGLGSVGRRQSEAMVSRTSDTTRRMFPMLMVQRFIRSPLKKFDLGNFVSPLAVVRLCKFADSRNYASRMAEKRGDILR
jgi:hypothetical protein